jgi:hypothetical protein
MMKMEIFVCLLSLTCIDGSDIRGANLQPGSTSTSRKNFVLECTATVRQRTLYTGRKTVNVLKKMLTMGCGDTAGTDTFRHITHGIWKIMLMKMVK